MKGVILVEGDAAIRDSLSIFLESMDIQVTVHADGNAILSGEYDIPDPFLLDKRLSGIDGLDICRYLKSRSESKDVPVIMMSANPSVTSLAKSAGAAEVIIKPYRLAEVRIC